MVRFAAAMVTAALGSAVLAGCAGEDEGRPGVVSLPSKYVNATGIDAKIAPKGTSLELFWKENGESHTAGADKESPQLFKATCFGEYPDLRVEVQAPGDAVMEAAVGKPVTLTFGDLEPVDIDMSDEAGRDYLWGPNGLEIKMLMEKKDAPRSQQRSSYDSFPDGTFELESASLRVDMLVTCP